MIKIINCLLIITFLLLATPAFAGDAIYVDNGTIEADATWSGVDGEAYTSSDPDFPGAGTGYGTLVSARNAMQGGDDIYIRGGTYDEGAIRLYSADNGTANDWTSIQSYPGEWAVIDANGDDSISCALGFRSDAKTDDSNYLQYWRFERLEVTGGENEGIAASGGPVIVRYCYIHDNINSYCGDNPGGFGGILVHDSVFEYNVFDKNGCSDTTDNHPAHLQIVSDYAYMDAYGTCDDGNYFTWATGLCRSNYATRRNIIRYNFFNNSDGRRMKGLHYKSHMVLTPHRPKPSTPDATAKTWGDKIHHNIFIDMSAFGMQQDFGQFYNNIIDSGDIDVRDDKQEPPEWFTGYNNTIIGGRLRVNYANIGSGMPSGSHRYNNPHYATEDITITGGLYNNIISGYSSGDVSQGFNFGEYMNDSDYDAGDVDYDSLSVRNNYYYDGNSYMFFNLEAKSGTCYDNVSKTDMESCWDTFVNNVEKESTEGTDDLYAGASGADQYKTNGDHSLGNGYTIADGGFGDAHPYLSGVTIPSYIGATDPDDNGWVDEVLDFDVAYFTAKDLQGDEAYDESWIEGEGTDTTAPTVSSASIGTDGETITINFSETVVTTGYNNGDFDLDCTTAGSNIALNSISGSGSSRTFAAATQIEYGDTCNLDYTGGADEIEDSAGNDLAAFSDETVTNNVPESTSGKFVPANFGSGKLGAVPKTTGGMAVTIY